MGAKNALKYGTIGASGYAAGPIVGTVTTAGAALIGAFTDDGDGTSNAAKSPDAGNFQYGQGNGAPTANQFAAQNVQSGLQQQQGQNNRESAFYGQANNNFNIANAAQGRGGLSIGTDPNDVQNQLAALGGTFQNASTLTGYGTRPMGDSYAAAQLKQGQDTAMAQQLSMARSGRSLGSGQAAMDQAAFNNSAINQATNQQAVSARIQEQNQYNQFQLGALGAANSAFGQAGQQATGIRQGNENVQAQNAQLQQSQEQVNNQTTGLYNQMGASQQQLGMQANNLGQQAQQFGVQQGANIQQAQLQANAALSNGGTPIALANQDNANKHDAADANALSAASGVLGSVGKAIKDSQDAKAAAAPAAAPAPVVPSMAPKPVISDEREKTKIRPLPELGTDASSGAYVPAGAPAVATQGNPEHFSGYLGSLARRVDQAKAEKQAAVASIAARQPPSYAQTIAALNNGYAESYNNPANVLREAPTGPINMTPQMHTQAQLDAQSAPRMAPASLRATAPPGGYSIARGSGANAATIAALSNPVVGHGNPNGYTRQVPNPPVSANRSFGAPEFDPRIQAYLDGGDPNPIVTPTAAPAPTRDTTYDNEPAPATPWEDKTLSDVHSKTRIRELKGQLASLGGPPSASFAPQQPDTGALDAAYQSQGGQPQAPAVDFRNAHAYEYEYKDPHAPGAAPGRQVGTMAQELERTSAAPMVHDTPTGKVVDTQRLPLALAPAVGEMQRRQDDLERQLAALQAPQWSPYQPSAYPVAR